MLNDINNSNTIMKCA